MTENVDTQERINKREPSKILKFRVKLPLASEVKEIADTEFAGNVSRLLRQLLLDRQLLAKLREDKASEAVALISRSSLTPRDLCKAGLAWSDWTNTK